MERRAWDEAFKENLEVLRLPLVGKLDNIVEFLFQDTEQMNLDCASKFHQQQLLDHFVSFPLTHRKKVLPKLLSK